MAHRSGPVRTNRLGDHRGLRDRSQPIFSTMVLAMAGVLIMTPNAISAAALMALIAGMELQVRAVEEPYLLKAHGPDFLAYAARVGRFVPFVGRMRNTQQATDGGP